MKTIRVGSRESRLAVVQSELVMDAIRAAHPEVGLELVTMKTTGDKILDRTLDKVGGKGLFVKELDAALLDGRVDLTVHSCKDLPMEEDPRIPLAGFSRREDPRDALVLPQGAEELDPSRPIGCASARRAVQLRALFPGVAVAPVRGNVLTRLRKLDEGQFSALVLAAAKDCGRIVTVEEHSIIGGLGEAVSSCVAEHCPVPVKRIGVNDEFGHSGPAADLLKQFGLCAEHIVEVTEAFCK